MKNPDRSIFIDPSYPWFNADGLFNLKDPILNRDDQLLPFHRLQAAGAERGIAVHTADFLVHSEEAKADVSDYYSLGILDNFEEILQNRRARLSAFIIMEPPVVSPILYASLPRLTEVFDKVYVHNVTGDGYSLHNVHSHKLQRFYWPIPYDDVLVSCWANKERLRRIVVINGSHNPRGRSREQYSHRIVSMAALARLGVVDLYGMGWRKWWSRSAMWLPYWRNRRALMSIYKGPCSSKFEVLSRYDFCLCYENMAMDGYITEKIFDCLYAGAIPLYKGAPDILDYVPAEVFIDCRKYSSVEMMWEDLASMPADAITEMRNAGRQYLKSPLARKFRDSLHQVFGV